MHRELVWGQIWICPQNDFLVRKSLWVYPSKNKLKTKIDLRKRNIFAEVSFFKGSMSTESNPLELLKRSLRDLTTTFYFRERLSRFPANEFDISRSGSGHRDRVTWACRLFGFHAPRPKFKSLWLGFQCRLLIHGTAACYSKLRCINIGKLLKLKSLLI